MNHNQTMTVVGTEYFTAPEILKGDRYDELVDVFSFGMVIACICCLPGGSSLVDCMWKGFERVKPDTQCSKGRVQSLLKTGILIPEVEGPECIKRLMRKCLSQKSEERPPFGEIAKMLSAEGGDIESTLRNEDSAKAKLDEIKMYWAQCNSNYDEQQRQQMRNANERLKARRDKVKSLKKDGKKVKFQL